MDPKEIQEQYNVGENMAMHLHRRPIISCLVDHNNQLYLLDRMSSLGFASTQDVIGAIKYFDERAA